MKKTIAEISKEALQIEQFLKGCESGEFITYDMLETATGVRMDTRGKGFMRTALNRLKMEYTCVHGNGIELASPENSMGIISQKVVKIDNSVKRAEKTYKNITHSFYDKLSNEDKKQVHFVGSVFGAIRLAANNAKSFFKRENPKVINS